MALPVNSGYAGFSFLLQYKEMSDWGYSNLFQLKTVSCVVLKPQQRWFSKTGTKGEDIRRRWGTVAWNVRISL